MTDDNQATLNASIAKLDRVIADLAQASKDATTIRRKAAISAALRDVVAIREALRRELAEPPTP